MLILYRVLYNIPKVEPSNFSDLPFPDVRCKSVILSVHYPTQAKGKDLKKKKGKKKRKVPRAFLGENFRLFLTFHKTSKPIHRMYSGQPITAKLHLDVAQLYHWNTRRTLVGFNRPSCSEFIVLGRQNTDSHNTLFG